MSKKLKPEPKLSVAKRQPPRWQHERNLTLIIWIAIPVIIALALGLVGYWGYDTYVGVWTQPIVKIGNETIGNATAGNLTKGNVTTFDMRYYVKMLRYYYLLSGGNVSTDTFPYQVLQYIENDELIIRGAPGLGIKVSQDEVTAKINTDMTSLAGGGGNSTGNITGNITLPQSDLGKTYQKWLNYVRLSDSEFRALVEANLLGQKINDHFTQSAPTEAKQVYVYLIKVDNEGNATEVESLLQNGGNFTAIAEEYSTDETSKPYGGDFGWVPEGILSYAIDPQLDQVAFSLTKGNISQPIKVSSAYYILKVAEISDSMPVGDTYQQILAYSAYNTWFTQQKNATAIKEYLDDTKITWAWNHIT